MPTQWSVYPHTGLFTRTIICLPEQGSVYLYKGMFTIYKGMFTCSLLLESGMDKNNWKIVCSLPVHRSVYLYKGLFTCTRVCLPVQGSVYMYTGQFTPNKTNNTNKTSTNKNE